MLKHAERTRSVQQRLSRSVQVPDPPVQAR